MTYRLILLFGFSATFAGMGKMPGWYYLSLSRDVVIVEGLVDTKGKEAPDTKVMHRNDGDDEFVTVESFSVGKMKVNEILYISPNLRSLTDRILKESDGGKELFVLYPWVEAPGDQDLSVFTHGEKGIFVFSASRVINSRSLICETKLPKEEEAKMRTLALHLNKLPNPLAEVPKYELLDRAE